MTSPPGSDPRIQINRKDRASSKNFTSYLKAPLQNLTPLNLKTNLGKMKLNLPNSMEVSVKEYDSSEKKKKRPNTESLMYLTEDINEQSKNYNNKTTNFNCFIDFNNRDPYQPKKSEKLSVEKTNSKKLFLFKKRMKKSHNKNCNILDKIKSTTQIKRRDSVGVKFERKNTSLQKILKRSNTIWTSNNSKKKIVPNTPIKKKDRKFYFKKEYLHPNNKFSKLKIKKNDDFLKKLYQSCFAKKKPGKRSLMKSY